MADESEAPKQTPIDHVWADEIRAGDIMHICMDCGKVTRSPQAPELEGRHSDEPDVQAGITRLRGSPPENTVWADTRLRPGGRFYKQNHFTNRRGIHVSEPISGGSCPECADATAAERYKLDQRALFSKVFEPWHVRTQGKGVFDARVEAPKVLDEDELLRLFGAKPRRRGIRRKKKDGA